MRPSLAWLETVSQERIALLALPGPTPRSRRPRRGRGAASLPPPPPSGGKALARRRSHEARGSRSPGQALTPSDSAPEGPGRHRAAAAATIPGKATPLERPSDALARQPALGNGGCVGPLLTAPPALPRMMESDGTGAKAHAAPCLALLPPLPPPVYPAPLPDAKVHRLTSPPPAPKKRPTHKRLPHPGKPKVYQGVRVKMTVKELLQQRRAKQDRGAEIASSERSEPVASGESLFPPCAAPYLDAVPESSWPSCLQPWPFQNWASCDEIPSYLEELVDSCLQAELPLDIPLTLAQDNLPCSPESFQTALTCLGSGLPEASGPSNFYYGDSPSQVSPAAPLGFTCPSLDAKNCMYPFSEENACQQTLHLPPAPGLPCCTPCGSQHLDTLRIPEYSPYANVDCRDYVAEDLWRDRSWDTCYS